MCTLPEELWRRILEIGVIESSCLNFKDLCCLSITCRRLNRLSSEDSLWSSLFSSDFKPHPALTNRASSAASSSSPTSCKFIYKIRYEREKEQKLWAHRRVVLRIESEIAISSMKIRAIEAQCTEEGERMKAAAAELSNLHKVRHASVALKVWQPEIVRGKQKKLVEQHDVPVESRISALEMELRLSKQQFAGYNRALKAEKGRLEAAKEKLVSVKYHPLSESSLTSSKSSSTSSRIDEDNKRRKKMGSHCFISSTKN